MARRKYVFTSTLDLPSLNFLIYDLKGRLTRWISYFLFLRMMHFISIS